MITHLQEDDTGDFLSPGRNIEVYEALCDAQKEWEQGLCIYDTHSRKILYANEGFSKLFRYGIDEVTHRVGVLSLVAPEKRPELEALISVQGSEIYGVKTVDTVAEKKGGETFAVRICAKKIENGLPHILILFADISVEVGLKTRLLQLEDELRRSRDSDHQRL